MLQKKLLQDIYSHLSVWHYSQKFHWVLSLQACSKIQNANAGYLATESLPKKKRKEDFPWLLQLLSLILGSHDSLHFPIILLTPSATKTIILGSPNDSPRFGQKRKITIHCHYSPVTIHWYYSPLLFTPKFCLFKGGCPLYLEQVFLMLSSGFLP